MSPTFYLPRILSSHDSTYTETELLAASSYVVVLAEPGGGKTDLMGSIAQQLGTTAVTARKFAHIGVSENNVPLVIDAFDELSKVDDSGIYKLLAKAEATSPSHVYLSSRSSEWDNAATNAFNEFLGHSPLVVRLREFDESEQRAIFEHHLPGEDFAAFKTEIARFDLEMLLPNPQFLKLFADAYIESERHFADKRSIFSQAVERLAKEANPYLKGINPTLSIARKVDISSEVFTKLLFAGAEGVCISEATENRMYPLLASLFESETAADAILATRLFKPSDNVDQHRPVHKIVAEYCAADYLTKRIADPADPLTLPKCLPIIAPNLTVRDELRGLLGWMAALGNKRIQESAINLDPYGVLANGDPSQLDHSSKRLLIHRLIEVEEQDPYFRRGDSWRRFSVAGFFTQDVVDEIKPLLTSGSDGHLRNLILELLRGSPAIKHLRGELRQLTLTPTESEHTRWLANRCLLDVDGDVRRSDLETLISEASSTSLSIAAEIIETLGPETFERAYLAEFLHVCSKLYPNHRRRHRRAIGDRYFLKKFIDGLDIATIEWLLDDLTKNLVCVCGKKPYECDCRNGISKIVGSMLDRYFELAKPPFDPLRVWQWVRNLIFHEQKGIHQSKAVQVLQNDNELHKGIIAHVFGTLTDRDEIYETKFTWHRFHCHNGLIFRGDDYKFIVDLAFETDNPDLWACFMEGHRYYQSKEERGPNDLRRHMRKQALKKTLFMQEWAKINRATAKQFYLEKREWRVRPTRKMKHRRRKQDEIRAANIEYFQDNRKLIEAGRDWNCLVLFAKLVLMHSDDIEQEVNDKNLVQTSLRNCLDFIAPHVPNLSEIAELRRTSKIDDSEIILYAACLEIMRFKGNLEEVNLHLLRALRIGMCISYDAVSNENYDALLEEVNRLLFSDSDSAENFLRHYIEPQLAQSGYAHPELWFLRREDTFRHLRATLSLEWLQRFRELELNPLNTLFEIAAQHSNRDKLKEIIAERCTEFMSAWPNQTENEDIERKRTFWLVRAWYFLDDTPETYWNWLKADKDTVLLLYERSGRMSPGTSSWPMLTSSKVEAILDAFIGQWPKVDLPNHWGSGSSKGENAYRFLTDVIWSINSDDPDDAIPVLERLLADSRFADLHNDLKSIHASQVRNKALRDFEPPTPQEIVNHLDRNAVVTVESLRQLVIEELQYFQKDIDGGEFNFANLFYKNGDRLDEERSRDVIAGYLKSRLEPQGISVVKEHELKDAKRSDFTVTKMIVSKKLLLVTEVKGQWHKDLYTAASTQLNELYSIHPDAAQQGIFLAIWFGTGEKVAGRKNHGIESAQELQISIEAALPPTLRGLIDVFVLDVSKSK
ncbi:hypothetical protein [Halomicronema sp. CCY15110]|uniref:hypothetical protein n=1 Tax=Halomicronema sp. CCY15110 TaxID=2767773 RepID=UPI0019505591|nr:hypothetical protein [Halomicronema sp. CCY15110]